MRAPKLREVGEAIKALVKGPYTIAFPKAPSVPFAAFRGKPQYDTKECVGCGTCQQVCPAKAIDLVDDAAQRMRSITLHLDNCIFCGQCQLNCITEKGIALTQEYDLATLNRQEAFERVEKKLLLCELCGAVIGAEEHVQWLARRLGPSAYTNPTVMLVSQKELGLVDEAPSPSPQAPLRADRIKILCPRCRRATTLNL
jgi:formate hydrogenlyase subunit 6/NADH:ubiquinone oxidoreductase subunit I